ncbi:hypothetical protein SS50377_22928 [Spironucleus salmonicida]|uniref:Uncharacterized protein n=2 Tax=Spironucleus salmonicida TaxID=348837 RepID=A0A9P8S039_9EUKA|nr:hypothetical protein SS50377_22928 [Spironucleus salmonicida]
MELVVLVIGGWVQRTEAVLSVVCYNGQSMQRLIPARVPSATYERGVPAIFDLTRTTQGVLYRNCSQPASQRKLLLWVCIDLVWDQRCQNQRLRYKLTILQYMTLLHVLTELFSAQYSTTYPVYNTITRSGNARQRENCICADDHTGRGPAPTSGHAGKQRDYPVTQYCQTCMDASQQYVSFQLMISQD